MQYRCICEWVSWEMSKYCVYLIHFYSNVVNLYYITRILEHYYCIVGNFQGFLSMINFAYNSGYIVQVNYFTIKVDQVCTKLAHLPWNSFTYALSLHSHILWSFKGLTCEVVHKKTMKFIVLHYTVITCTIIRILYVQIVYT